MNLLEWVNSGGSITVLWKYVLVVSLVWFPLSYYSDTIATLYGIIVAFALVATVVLVVGLSVKGGAQIEAEEYLKAKNKENKK